MKKTIILAAVAALCCTFNASADDNGQIVKTGYSYGPLPALSFDSDKGFQYGALLQLYNYGDGSSYPMYKSKWYFEISAFTKGSQMYTIMYDKIELFPGVRFCATAKYMKDMFANKNCVMTDSEKAYYGAYNTEVGVPFCFFGPGMQSAFTVIHELGHYYAAAAGDFYSGSMDLCETQSQGNEMLFTAYLESALSDNLAEALGGYKLAEMLELIIDGTVMDEFEEKIYKGKLPANADGDYFDRIMAETVESYGDKTTAEWFLESMLWRWRNDGITNPVYFLSYAVSAEAAINLYCKALEDYKGAAESYRLLAEGISEDDTYVQTLKKAGIASPFEESSYIRLQKLFSENRAGRGQAAA